MEEDAAKSAIIQNLKDAGCKEDVIKRFMNYAMEGKLKQQLKLLAKHRCLLLDEIHEEQKKIDCLDYLIYKMKKQVSYVQRLKEYCM